MSQIVHEGTHALDYLNGVKGSDIFFEKKAYFHERAFQQAVGIEKDFDTIEEMIQFIKTEY